MNPKVYLSGPIAGLTFDEGEGWRATVTKQLAEFGIEGLSPLRGKEFLRGDKPIGTKTVHGHPLALDAGITTRDRFDTMRCDFMLVNLLGAAKVSIGTMIELGWADAARVPIVLAMSPISLHNHPIVRGVAGYITDDLDEAVDIVLTAIGRKAAA